MKIAYVTTHYPTPDPACLDTRAGHYWAREWVRAGHEVAVFHLRSKLVGKGKRAETPQEYLIEGIPVLYAEYARLCPHTDRVSARVKYRTAEKIAGRIEAMDPDVVICDFSAGNWDVIRALKERQALKEKLFVPVFNNCDLYSVRRARAIVRESCVVGVRSRALAQRIRSFAPDKPVFIAYSGAPLIDRRPVLQKIEEQRTPRRLLYVGDFIPLKNVDILLEALSRLTQCGVELWVVGDGPLEGKLKAHAKTLRLKNVEFPGRVSREDVLDKMLQSDIFVMVSSPESFGIVYIEAMAAGCYVIGTKGEGIDGVLADGRNGALVPARDADSLARAIRNYLALSPDRRTAILKAALQTADEYSEEAVARRMLEDIERLKKQ